MIADRYRILEQAGVGGLALVWKAHDIETGDIVAIKSLKADRAVSFDRFFGEVQTMAALDHPNILRVDDYGVADTPYIVLEWMEQGSLEHFRVPNFETFRVIVLQILDALAHAHARGVIHRDLKPDNVLVGSQDPLIIKLADFGIAHIESAMSGAKEPGIAGTPPFMPPEQFRNQWRRFGPATDLYALGCMCFAMVSGRLPFEARSFSAFGIKHINDPVPPIVSRFKIPSELDRWIRILLEKDPRDRYVCAADAAYALAKMEQQNEVTTFPDAPMVFWSTGELTNPPSSWIATTKEKIDPLETPDFTSWHRKTSVARAISPIWLLRKPPLVGRVAERDQLWQQLKDVSDGFGHVHIYGASGIGTTHLASWFAERASEQGLARRYHVYAGERRGTLELVRAMLTQHFRAWGMATELVRGVIDDELDSDLSDRDSLVDVISGIITRGYTDVGLSRVKLIELGLRIIARDPQRTTIVVVDAAPAEQVEALVDIFRTHFAQDRVLLLTTGTKRAPASLSQIKLGKLNADEMARFFEVNGVTPKGRIPILPITAVQFVSEFLEGGEWRTLGLEQLVRRRVKRLVGSFENSEVASILLSVCATFAQEFQTDDVHKLAEALGVSVPERFVANVVRQGFFRRTDYGISFSSPRVRKAIASDEPYAHRACASVLKTRESLSVFEWRQLSDHQLAAGDGADAITSLRLLHDQMLLNGLVRELPELLQVRTNAVKVMGNAFERNMLSLHKARLSVYSGARNRSHAQAVIDHRDPSTMTGGYLYRAAEKMVVGESAYEDFELGASYADDCADELVRWEFWNQYGSYLVEMGDIMSAQLAYKKIPLNAYFQILQHRFHGLAMCAIQVGDFEKADALLSRSENVRHVEVEGARSEGAVLQFRIMLLVLTNRLAEAKTLLDEMHVAWKRTGIAVDQREVHSLNALVSAGLGDVERALVSLDAGEMFPNFYPSHKFAQDILRVWLLVASGDFAGATRAWELRVGTVPDNVATQSVTLWIWEKGLSAGASAIPGFQQRFESLLRIRDSYGFRSYKR